MKPQAAPPSLSVIVPVGARRAADIGALYREYRSNVAATGATYEFIFVLDGPRPEARRALETLLREGEEFTIKGMRTVRSGGYEMTVLDGAMSALVTRDFPAGTVQVDMAQPMANAAFYYLEPQARDGFVGWGVMNDVLRQLTTGGRQATYPIFKMRRALVLGNR